MWKGVISLPPLTSAQHDVWVAALLQLQGMTNAFQFGDPLKRSPRGVVRGTPAVNTAIAMPTGSSTLYTLGWTPNSTNLLLAGDYIQLGLRLHRVLDSVNSDVDGKASVPIWPSLREAPSGNITYNSPKGLFRLATSEQDWDYDFTKLTNLSISIQEYR